MPNGPRLIACVLLASLTPAHGGEPPAFRTRGAVTARAACGYADQPANMLARSADFPAEPWQSRGARPELLPLVQAAADDAPDGTKTAARVSFRTGDGPSCLETDVAVTPGQPYTFSFSVKGPKGARLAARGVSGGDFSTIPLSGTWQRVHLTEVARSESGTLSIGAAGLSHEGPRPDGVLLWGPQLVRGWGRVPYQPTTGSGAPPHPLELVAPGEVRISCPPADDLQPEATNLLCWSTDLRKQCWKASGLASIAGRDDDGPAIPLGAQLIRELPGPGPHRIAQAFRCGEGGPLVASVFVRAMERSHCVLTLASGDARAEGRFEIPKSGGSTRCVGEGARIDPIGRGWHRIQVALAGPCASSGEVALSLLADISGDPAYEGNASGSVLLWGPQVEAGSVASSYIPTFFSPETRLADEPVTGPAR